VGVSHWVPLSYRPSIAAEFLSRLDLQRLAGPVKAAIRHWRGRRGGIESSP